MPVEIITEDHVAVRGKTTQSYWEEQEVSKNKKYDILKNRGYVLTKQEDCNSYWVIQDGVYWKK